MSTSGRGAGRCGISCGGDFRARIEASETRGDDGAGASVGRGDDGRLSRCRGIPAVRSVVLSEIRTDVFSFLRHVADHPPVL